MRRGGSGEERESDAGVGVGGRDGEDRTPADDDALAPVSTEGLLQSLVTALAYL